ncbi:MAG: hypothetical protein L0Z50_02965 [Verrucomicrobiales bacterium]|nr:hypothetical protein [Verrucomicrobiales bacterium]
MKGIQKKKALTLGEFIMSVYDVCGQQRAKGIVQRAVNTHLVHFLGQRRFIVS